MSPLREWKSSLLWLAVLLSAALAQDPDGGTHGFINFAQNELIVNEGTGQTGFTTVQLPMVREGGVTGEVFAVITIENANDDFHSASVVASFLDGQTSPVSAAVVIVDDQVPEGNETFLLTITDARQGAEVGLRNTLTLVIQASDEPFGTIQFDQGSLSVSVDEPLSPSIVQLTVTRGPGTVGRVTVDFQVTTNPSGVDDLDSFMGQVVFDDQEASRPLNLTILPDDLPERDEVFTITLLNPRGGATLAAEGVVAMVTIRENDSPVRWNTSLVEVEEDAGSAALTVTRGLLEDGSTVGDLTQTTTVSVSTVSGTASSGLDFNPISTTLTFGPGVTTQTVTIPVIDDSEVEGDETFSVVLSSPSANAVLVTPSTITVVIAVNDNAGGVVSFASPGPVIVEEDTGEFARFIVQRLTGTFGNLTIDWTITDNLDQSLASGDFQPPSGTLFIPDGANQGTLEIVAFDDDVPEVAEGFSVELVRVSTGDGVLSETGVRVAQLIVTESDDVYGLVEWGQSLTVVDTTPRELRLNIGRSGGDIGTISIDYTIMYLPAGTSVGDPSAVTVAMRTIQLQGGASSSDFSVTIPDSMFLDPSGSFHAALTNTSLVGGAIHIITPAVSPSIGERQTVSISIPASAANGFIAFDPTSLQVFAEEPANSTSVVNLIVTRSGFYGDVEITWVLTLQTADISDVGALADVIIIPNGANTAQLGVTIVADDLPETNELFIVSLIATEPDDSQSIQQDQSVATVTILQNDAAEGVFSISSLTAGPFFVLESGIVSITIVRDGGTLTTETISYTVPGGGSDIFGSQNFRVFAEGEREQTVTLLINNDNEPENNETFSFEISSLNGLDIIGMPSTVEITILANDDYAGLFLFDSASLDQTAVEPRDGQSSVATFTVQRSRGRFTDVVVMWEVVGGGADVDSTGGMVPFVEGQMTGTFDINILPDDIPEVAETLTVRLTSVSGDGNLGTPVETDLTIAQNDDPVNFRGSFTQAAEGETVEFVIERGGQAADTSDVTFVVTYSSATADDVSITPVGRVVTFAPGQTEAVISVSVVNDDDPEENEFLEISLVSVTGDAVIVMPSDVTLLITPSDNPNGVFQFEMATAEAEEGDTIFLTVERLGGSFGTVILSWSVHQLNGTQRISNDVVDISPPANFLTFDPGNETADIVLNIVDDEFSELSESFEIEISILNIDGDSVDGARIGDIPIATLMIAPSDDPYGLFSVARDYIEVAEDVPLDNPSLGNLSLTVRRDPGLIGEVRLVWEILPEAVPSYTDLLLVGESVGGVTNVSPRPHTGTRALRFRGEPGDLLTVPLAEQPDLFSEMTISLWLRPTSGTAGILVAQTTGSTPVYRLALIADSTNYIIRFSYQSGGSLLTIETVIAQASLVDGDWHSLVLSATNQIASFYLDGIFLIGRTLTSPTISGSGQLTVGGISDGLSSGDFYSGDFQDVRIFTTALSQSQVTALSSDLAAQSITPISGYLTYPPGVSTAVIQASTIDDTTPEPSQRFAVQLANTVGGANINPSGSVATLNVLKSDSSNGVFGFDSSSRIVTTSEGAMVSLLVTRTIGFFGEVFVYWEARLDGLTSAEMDFEPTSGRVEFAEGQMRGYLNFTIIDELLPELQEEFVVTLTSAVASDNETSSTPLSGASIDSGSSQSAVSVVENDSPYGLFQFVTSPPLPGVTITPATEQPEIFVEESIGTVTVYLVRAQGRLGNVSIEFLTSEESAVGGGGSPDFVPTAGSLDFVGEVLVQPVTVTVLDNELPELQKTFYVNLTNPSGTVGTPDLDIGQSIAIHILPSDDAFGQFNFDTQSQSIVVAEQLGGTPVTLTVEREGGVFGDVTVYWRITQSSGSEVIDITPSEGPLFFPEGSGQEDIQLTIRDDMTGELSEVFTVTLLNVTAGASLGDSRTAVITIAANDHPYGLFTFAPPSNGVAEGQEVVIRVIREFGMVGQVSVDVVSVVSSDPRLSSLGLDLPALDAMSRLAVPEMDYTQVDVTLTFQPGQTVATFNLTIIDDSTAELGELVFLILTQATLNASSVDSVDTSVLPQVASGNDSIAIVEIAENDNARGVIDLSAAAVITTESSEQILSIRRSQGTFGQISVQWEAIPMTATPDDYTPTGSTVTFAPGETEMPLPLVIIDDTAAEFDEEFLVRLVSVDRSAILGDVTVATVTIEASDDPNGALEFVFDSLDIAEPDSGTAEAVFTVQRQGGAVGVVEVVFEVTSVDGSDVSDDVVPVNGTLQFVSNSVQQFVRLSVLADNIPELAEVFNVRLGRVTGGARVEPSRSTATLTIPENDSPYGVVSFANLTSIAIETGDSGSSVTMVPVIRSFGTFGDLLLTYSVEPADAATLALASGTPLLDFYTDPISDTALTVQSLLQAMPASLEECARECLGNQACRSFSIGGTDCRLYFAASSDGADTMFIIGTDYYEKIEELVTPFYQAVASEGNDFTPVIGQLIVIPSGVSETFIPVTIVGDSLPELNESLVVRLLNVELDSNLPEAVTDGPELGSIQETNLVILENNDPRGRFAIVGSNGAAVTRVSESENVIFGISLTVERQGGTLGEVSVRWDVVDSTAVEGEDYQGTGAVLTLANGISRATIALTILADDVPERDETIQVVLSDPTGGATVGEMNSALVIIEANDQAAGVVGFDPLSRSAVIGEGESGAVEVVRSVSALGVVRVNWTLTTEDGGDPSSEFVSTSGTAIFQEGENTTEIVISVEADGSPEIEEVYTLTITDVETLSEDVAPSGHATLDLQATMATVTIRASNNPHGVVVFQSASVQLMEGGGMGVSVVRQFGRIGVIDVGYTVETGSLHTLTGNETLATPGVDFIAESGTLTLIDDQQSAVIPVSVLDDSDPELSEFFLVRLTSVTLVSGASSSLPPSVGANNVTEVLIPANDSPQGEMTFVQATYDVTEDLGIFQLPILRMQGSVGQVFVVYFVTNGLAVNGEDYIVSQLAELTFEPGQTQRTVSIEIVNDDRPEVPEEFCVQLQLPRGGAVLGNITTTCITIAANDDAYGVFSFNASSLTTTIQETEGTPTDSNVAELRVNRDGGLFGQVTVPFEVRSASGELTTEDLSPLMGSALVFNQDDSFRILQLEALQDTFPELNETFTITLLPPIELGRLATSNTIATITIAANQSPYGVFELSVVGGANSVEEGVVLVDFELERDFGTFGEVAVITETVDGTAIFSPGSTPVFSAFQTLSAGEVWHSLTVDSQTLLVLGGDSEAQLLAWRGVFTPVQILPASQVSAIASFSPQTGVYLLLIANGGQPGNRELTVDVYLFTAPESVVLAQSLPALGVTDLATFSAGGQWYVFVANGEDSSGSIVDSTIWRWNGTAFEWTQTLQTIGASSVDVFTLSGSVYAAVGSSTDTRSQVYIWRNGQFGLHHTFDSNSVQDILFLPPNSLAVASQSLDILVWSTQSETFQPSSMLAASQPIRLELFDSRLYVTNSNSPGQIFALTDGTWIEENTSLPISRHLYPFTLASFYLASAGASRSVVMETLSIDSSGTDYYSRRVNLLFAPGESLLRFSVRIVDDETPEIGETFTVQLSDPVGGATIGTGSVTIEILTNDDAHGLVGFDEGSLSVIVSEGDVDSTVTLNVTRMGGTFGRVSVAWEISGGNHGDGEITPTQGVVVFEDRQSLSSINLTVAGDTEAELSEMTFVMLREVLENGIPEGGDQSRGAMVLSSRQQAVITVQASDAPHGVVMWSPAVVMATEEEGVNSVAMLTLTREFGSIGAIVIRYSTSVASFLPEDQQATELVDFVPTSSGEVVMGDRVTAATVEITILHDDLAELTESFFVNITSVQLINEADRQGSLSDSPRVGHVDVVEVQILENDDSRGQLSFAETDVSVEEVIGGHVMLEVRRAGGVFGTVGAEFTAMGVSASSVDFEPAFGTVTLESGVDVGFIEITIINDPDPEMEETFEVILVNGLGGATIGEPSSALVTILSNDDINGVFSFTDNSLLFLIPESTSSDDPMGVVTLTVQRMENFVGVVTVYWEVSEDGRMDLEPISGNLTFNTAIATQSFQVRAINDGLPEQFEAFSVSLIRTEGGGRIVDPREARIAIQSSNDPSGVIGFIEYPEGIIAEEGAEIQVGVVRRSGTEGTVTLTWAITPPDSTVFVTTSDTVVFVDGQSEATFAIQTLSDSTPEVARLFSLEIISTTLAGVDVNATQIDLIIAASDRPHGTVEFVTGSTSVSEGEMGVAITVTRGTGTIGDIRVNFDLEFRTAGMDDFNISAQYLLIQSGQAQASLSLNVFEDSLPEIAETFTLAITSVELLGNGGRDFEISGNLSLIDQPPVLGSTNQITVTIQPSDDPFGSITLTQNTYTAVEGGVANITLIRMGGVVGVATAMYTTTDGQAMSPADYAAASGTVVFPAGENTAEVLISIEDDLLAELEEDFTFTLVGSDTVTLGPITVTTVIIEASDSPFGEIGFDASVVANGIHLDNPTVADGPFPIGLNVNREQGLEGTTEITWEVRRSISGELARDDILPVSDVLILTAGQTSGLIRFDVLPSSTDEVEETFIVTLALASNNVFILLSRSSVAITVAQLGNPQGVVSFIGDVLSDQRVNEGSTISLPVTRTGNAELELMVDYVVLRLSGTGLIASEVSPASGRILMPFGISQVTLELLILSDGVPELDESYQVVLTGTNAEGVGVDQLANIAPFTVGPSDSPYGLFSLSSATITVDSTQPVVSRSLHYTIDRGLGQVGDVTVVIANTYSDPSVDYIPSSVTRLVPSNTPSLTVTLPVVNGAVLPPGSQFTAMITSTVVASPSEFAGLSADFVDTTLVGLVTADVSNTLISFDPPSLSATVDDSDGRVVFTVIREGVLDTVDLQWMVGSLVGGSLTPPTGSLTLLPDQVSSGFTLTATPTEPHGLAEVFSVSLTAQSRTADFQALVSETAGEALVEPWGVVELGGAQFSGVEGQVASVSVWRRYGSVGDIVITGVASTSTEIPANQIAALEGVDFPVSPQSVTMTDGQTTANIEISLPDNFVTSSLKIFTITLTSVRRATATGSFTSPRLASSNLIGQVTIVDDEGGAGVFRLSPNVVRVEEGEDVSFTVMREGGSAGEVSVLVQTVNGEATGGADYVSLSQQLVFGDGVTERLLSVTIVNDDLPEPDEGFSVQLVQGGGALVDSVNGVLAVTIPASDNPGGVFSISTPSPLTLVDGLTPSATITVTRTGGLFGTVTITWETFYADSAAHEPLGNFLSATSGRINFLSGQTVPDIVIQLNLISNAVPAGGETFNLRLSSTTPGVVFETSEIQVTVQARTVAVIRVRPEDRERVVTASGPFTMTIERTDGLQLTSSVVYNTSSTNRPNSQMPTVGDLTFDQAQAGVHFARIENAGVTFQPEDSSETVSLSVISVPTTPVAFYMDIGIQGSTVASDTAVIVVMPSGALSDLYSLYFQALRVASLADLESVSSSLETVVNGASNVDDDQANIIRLIIDHIIQFSNDVTAIPSCANIADTNYATSMLNIFNTIITEPSFTGQPLFVESMKNFAYSLVRCRDCPTTNTDTSVINSRSGFYMRSLKIRPTLLTNKQFLSSGSSDYVQFPSQSLPTTQQCLTVHFIELLRVQVFGLPTFGSKAMSVGVAESGIQPVTDDPLLLRLHVSPAVGAIPNASDGSTDCIQWDTTRWSSEFCRPRTEYGNVLLEDSILCECGQFGDLAVSSDLRLGYRWTWIAGVSAAFVAIVMVLVMLVHLCYLSRTQLATRILINLCLAIFLFQMLLLIDIFASPSSASISDDGCVALGALLHFTIILQFVFILAMAVALWVNFMGFTDGREPLVIYIIISWIFAIIVVVATILIGRFAVPLTNQELYFHTNGDLCFIPLLSASLLSVVLPVVVAMLLVVAFLSYSCVYWSRWEDYHNMYHDSFNRTEIPLLIVFFVLIFFTGLAGYLHVYVTVVYTYAAFVALNVIQGLYALIVYCFMSFHTLTRKHKKFVLGDEVEPLSVPEEPDYLASMSDLTTSRHKMDPKEEWAEFENDSDMTPVVGMGVTRYNHDAVDGDSQYSVEGSQDESHLDDLMFMLKTQTYQSDKGSKGTPDRPKGAEHLELRRISIADTHL